MPLRAPWNKGWIRRAMPIVSFLVLANTFAIFTLAAFNVAALDLSYDDPPRYVKDNAVLVRVQLVFYWCTIPLILLITTTCEKFCLWTDRLSPILVVTSSLLAIGAWTLQLVLWELCINNVGGDNTPGYCPYVYQGDGWGRYPNWEIASPQGAGYAVPTIFILYIIQICFAAKVMHRQQRTSFRKSDMRQSWVRQMEEATSDVALISPQVQRRFTSPVLQPNEGTQPTRSRHLSYADETQPLSPFDRAGRPRSNTATSDSQALTPLDILSSPNSQSRSNSSSEDGRPPVSPQTLSVSNGGRSRSSTYSQPSTLSLPTEVGGSHGNTYIKSARSRASTVSSAAGRSRYYSDVTIPVPDIPSEPDKTYPANERISTERRASRSNLNLALVKGLPESLPFRKPS